MKALRNDRTAPAPGSALFRLGVDCYLAMEFKECASCSEKPGHPALCEPCVHNRFLIEKLKAIIIQQNNTPHAEATEGRR